MIKFQNEFNLNYHGLDHDVLNCMRVCPNARWLMLFSYELAQISLRLILCRMAYVKATLVPTELTFY